MIEEFKKYVNNYDLNDRFIKLKYNHSIRVMELALKYAEKLGFNEEEKEIAIIIGLLHDIGRFEQIKVYNTFNDQKSIDHADYGIKILFDDRLIEKFISTRKYDDIIKFAIKNHNKYEIEKNNNEEYMKQAKLIRDVDKIDILYLMAYLEEIDMTITDEEISREVLECIKKHQIILTKIKRK